MDLMKMGKDLLADKLGDKAGGIMDALSGLAGGSGNLDMGSLMNKLKEGGLADKVDSWMGDGDNSAVSADELKAAFGEDKIAAASTKMGVDSNTAAQQLSDALPDLADKFSAGGSLLDASALMEKLGGASGVLDMAKGLLKK